MKNKLLFSILVASILSSNQLFAQENAANDAAELAKKLSNPISSLISVPLQNNTDVGIGDNNGVRNTLNIQPVIPIGISPKINLITRVILPVVSQYNITGVGKTQTGLSDVVMSMFLSPAVSKGGLTWGAGPVLLIPTGTDDFLTGKKFGVGPTAVALYQNKGITVGGLINQIWSVAGDDKRTDVNSLFFQPFLTYNWKSGAGIGANLEMTQNWEANTTMMWLNPTLTAVTGMGKQKVQFAIGPKINLVAPEGSKADFGVRTVLVFLFPK